MLRVIVFEFIVSPCFLSVGRWTQPGPPHAFFRLVIVRRLPPTINGWPLRSDLAVHLDGAPACRKGQEQLFIVVQPAHRMRQQTIEPARIFERRLRHVTHADFKVLAVGIDGTTMTLFPRTNSRLIRSAGTWIICSPPVTLESTRTPFFPSARMLSKTTVELPVASKMMSNGPYCLDPSRIEMSFVEK